MTTEFGEGYDIGPAVVDVGLRQARLANFLYDAIIAKAQGEEEFSGVDLPTVELDVLMRKYIRVSDEAGALIGRESYAVVGPDGLLQIGPTSYNEKTPPPRTFSDRFATPRPGRMTRVLDGISRLIGVE